MMRGSSFFMPVLRPRDFSIISSEALAPLNSPVNSPPSISMPFSTPEGVRDLVQLVHLAAVLVVDDLLGLRVRKTLLAGRSLDHVPEPRQLGHDVVLQGLHILRPLALRPAAVDPGHHVIAKREEEVEPLLQRRLVHALVTLEFRPEAFHLRAALALAAEELRLLLERGRVDQALHRAVAGRPLQREQVPGTTMPRVVPVDDRGAALSSRRRCTVARACGAFFQSYSLPTSRPSASVGGSITRLVSGAGSPQGEDAPPREPLGERRRWTGMSMRAAPGGAIGLVAPASAAACSAAGLPQSRVSPRPRAPASRRLTPRLLWPPPARSRLRTSAPRPAPRAAGPRASSPPGRPPPAGP